MSERRVPGYLSRTTKPLDPPPTWFDHLVGRLQFWASFFFVLAILVFILDCTGLIDVVGAVQDAVAFWNKVLPFEIEIRWKQ